MCVCVCVVKTTERIQSAFITQKCSWTPHQTIIHVTVLGSSLLLPLHATLFCLPRALGLLCVILWLFACLKLCVRPVIDPQGVLDSARLFPIRLYFIAVTDPIIFNVLATIPDVWSVKNAINSFNRILYRFETGSYSISLSSHSLPLNYNPTPHHSLLVLALYVFRMHLHVHC